MGFPVKTPLAAREMDDELILHDKRSGRVHRLGSLTLVLASVMVALLVCEVVLRLFRTGENVYTTATLGVFGPDPELGWVLKPDMRVQVPWNGRPVVIRTDTDGYRIPDGGVSKVGAEQFAFAGDSYVFGNEVNAEETFVHLVGEASTKRSVNVGVGDTVSVKSASPSAASWPKRRELLRAFS